MPPDGPPTLAADVLSYYAAGMESDRLETDVGRLERLRTRSRIPWAARVCESDPLLRAVSAHLLGFGHRS